MHETKGARKSGLQILKNHIVRLGQLRSCRIKKEWSNCCRSVLGRSDLLLLTNVKIFNFVSQNSFIEKCNIHITGTEPVFK